MQDPFGAGMRISTRYAYLGGKVCAWLTIPEPTSGTIFGMYLIDIHPKGEQWFRAVLSQQQPPPPPQQQQQQQEQPGWHVPHRHTPKR
jgi:hypothetical protein